MDASRRVVLSRSARSSNAGDAAELALDEFAGRGFLVLVAELFQGAGRGVLVDALLGEFPAERALGEFAALGPGPNPHVGKVRVVHELHFFEAVQHGLGDVVRNVALGQLAGELQPALGRVRQLPQDNGARDGRGSASRSCSAAEPRPRAA